MAQQHHNQCSHSRWQNICPTLLSRVAATTREEREKIAREETPIQPEPIPAPIAPVVDIPLDKTWEDFCPPIMPTEQPVNHTPQQNTTSNTNASNSDLPEFPPDLEFCLTIKLFNED